jgi:hypothetical protein
VAKRLGIVANPLWYKDAVIYELHVRAFKDSNADGIGDFPGRTEGSLCVANLSRFSQQVDLDLSEAEGAIPVEMLGYVEFPDVERQPYRATLAPTVSFGLTSAKSRTLGGKYGQHCGTGGFECDRGLGRHI